MPETFVFQEGARITEDLMAGKMLGDGVQGQVYVLKRPDGGSTDQLLKVLCCWGHVMHPHECCRSPLRFAPLTQPTQCIGSPIAGATTRSWLDSLRVLNGGRAKLLCSILL